MMSSRSHIKRSMRNHVLAIMICMLFLLPMVMIYLPVSENASATVPVKGSVYNPTAGSCNRYKGTTSDAINNGRTYNGVYSNINPTWVDTDEYQRVIAADFSNFASYSPYWDVLEGDYFDLYPNATVPPDSGTLIFATVLMFGKPFSASDYTMNSGWFGIYLGNQTLATNFTWWTMIPNSYPYSTVINKNNTSPYLINSSIIPYDNHAQVIADNDYNHYWNITSYVNISVLKDPHFSVVWNHPENITGNWIDYLGIYYKFYTMEEISGYEEEPFTEADSVQQFFGLIWLLIIFLPSIVMTEFVPKYGFAVGMTLMLIIIGFTQTGFFQYMILGLFGIGIMLYKGD